MENMTLGQIATGLSFLMVLFGGLSYMLKPVKNYQDKQKEVDERIKKIEEHQDNDNKKLNRLEADTEQILLSVNALLNHSIDNNHNEQLKERKQELDQYLIKR